MLKIVKLNSELRIAKEKREKLAEQAASFALREKQLTDAFAELRDDTPQEDVDILNSELGTFEQDKETYDKDVSELDAKIAAAQKEIDELNANNPAGDPPPAAPPAGGERKHNTNMEVRDHMPMKRTRSNPFGQSPETRAAYLARPEVKEFYERLIQLAGEKRAVNNAELGIPEIMMAFFRDSVEDYSVLLSRVSLRRIRGDGKAIIAGDIPEAIWTECCANLNELSIDFSAMYVYCHKVAGYIPVCNATLEDFGGVNGIPTLASEIEFNLLKAIGLALDKAIVYGDGENMPLGFIHSLPMTANPVKPTEVWPSYASNVKSVSGTGITLFQNIMKAVATSKRRGSTGRRTFIMNETTWDSIIAPESLAINAAGQMVAAANNTFPIIGGDIVFLDFIPHGDIVGGYLNNYILAERMGIQMAMSEHVFFLQDNTVWKATARYDGSPVVPFRDSFFAINVMGGTPATSATFPPDTANEPEDDGLGA